MYCAPQTLKPRYGPGRNKTLWPFTTSAHGAGPFWL